MNIHQWSMLLGAAAIIGCTGSDPEDTDTSPDATDADGDGFPEGDDCDDTNADINASAPELCDGIDNDCDTEIDEDATDATIWYVDSDEDGYGAPNLIDSPAITACEAPSGYVDNSDDCNDVNAAANPNTPEICGDMLDNDCNGLVDEAEAVDALSFYPDGDGDRYGDDTKDPILACVVPTGYALEIGDCDDTTPLRNPGLPELCDGIDNDCDGEVIEDGIISRGIFAFTTFAAALSGADDRDELYVCPGTYTEDVVLTTSINMRGIYGAAVTTIQGTGSGPVITVNGPNVNIVGLTITGGDATEGGGINAERAQEVIVEGCVVTGNSARTDGGGVYGTLNALVVIDSTISNNDARNGGGIYTPNALVLSGATLSGNDASADGGGLYAEGNTDLQGATISMNTAEQGAGVYLSGGDVHIMDAETVIENNIAEDRGGGLYVTNASPALDDSTLISENQAGIEGGGLFLDNGGLTDGQVAENSAPDGAGMFIRANEFTVDSVNVYDNEASGDGGGAYIDSSANFNLSTSFFSGNIANGAGGGVFITGSAVEAAGTDLVSNTAESGGGIYLDNSSLTASLGVINSNLATDQGGGVYLGPTALLNFLNTDFGEDATDNLPSDVYVEAIDEGYQFGTSATQDCGDEGC